MRFVAPAGLFQPDGHLDAIGRGQRVELQPLGMLSRPLVGEVERLIIGYLMRMDMAQTMSD